MYPNKEQRERLDFTIEMCRQTYNSLLEELQNQAKIDRKAIQHKIVELKDIKPELKEIYSKTLQYECYRLFSNLSALRVLKRNGKKVGKLRFKGKGWFKTININQSGFSFEQKGKKGILHLSKIGDIKVKSHRQVEGEIKQITIKKSNNKYYAIIITNAKIILTCGEKIIGIDLGINHYLVDSENNFIEHPKLLEKYQMKLKQAYQDLSRKKKGSNNRIKAKEILSKIHEKIENSREDFLHKLSIRYIKDCKIIIVEDLKIKEMMMNFYNSKNMADASWGTFLQFLAYKAENAGCKIVKISPKNTTKVCSKCGNIQDMPIWKRTYKCGNCGLEIDRDYNSAINIKNKFLGKELAYVENNPSVQSEQGLSMKQEAITAK